MFEAGGNEKFSEIRKKVSGGLENEIEGRKKRR
jgi:hypothetical protein